MQALQVEFETATSTQIEQSAKFAKYTKMALYDSKTVEVDMRLSSDPPDGYFTKPLSQVQVDFLTGMDQTGNLRFSVHSLNTAFLVVDDRAAGHPTMTDDMIKDNLSAFADKKSLSFPVYVIAGRHSTAAAVKLLKEGRLEEKYAKRPSYVWRMTDIEREGAIVLGTGDNRTRKVMSKFELTFLDQVCITLLSFLVVTVSNVLSLRTILTRE